MNETTASCDALAPCDARAPPAPANKPTMRCVCCKGTEFACNREEFRELFPLTLQTVMEIVCVKYFNPPCFTISVKGGSQAFVSTVLQKRTQEEDMLSFHVENSPNYEHVRRNYALCNETLDVCTFERRTSSPVDRSASYCVQCYANCLKKQKTASLAKMLKEVAAKPEFFNWSYWRKPYGSQYTHTKTEDSHLNCRECCHCSKRIGETEMYVGSQAHPDVVLCLSGFQEFHRKLHTEQ